MLPDRVSNPGPLTYESGAIPIALRGPATEEKVGRQYQRVDRKDFASSTRAAENRSRWKGIVANTSVVPRRPSRVMGWNRIDL